MASTTRGTLWILSSIFSSLLRKDFPLFLKLQLLVFLDEFSLSFFTSHHHLLRLIDALKAVVHAPLDVVASTFKDQFMVSATSILICASEKNVIDPQTENNLVELLLTVINRPNFGSNRHTRGVACECLRELERWKLGCSRMWLYTCGCFDSQHIGSDGPFRRAELRDGFGFGFRFGFEYEGVEEGIGVFAGVAASDDSLRDDGVMCMINPVAVALELQPSMLKVQLFGMIHSFDPVLCHIVLGMYLRFLEAFDGQEGEKTKPTIELCSTFYPALFDPLALKALNLDLLAFSSVCAHILRLKSGSDELIDSVKLFENGLVCVSSFKWLPPMRTETAVAFRTFHKFLIASSSHSDNDPSTTRNLLDSAIFHTLQVLRVKVEDLVPVVVAFVDRLLSCQKHSWLEITENQTIPPRGLLEFLTTFMIFLVEKHGPDTGMKSWSQGSRALGICRTMLMRHHSSRLFLRLSRLLAFICLYFLDLEVRDNSRIYLRMLVCIPGKKPRDILSLGDMILGISPSSHSTSFFNVQSPRPSQKFKLSNLVVSNTKPAYLESIRELKAPVEEKDFSDSSNTEILPETGRINQSTTRATTTFNRMWGLDKTVTSLEEIDALPAIYATVLKFSSSAPYGSIPSYCIPFLLGEPYNQDPASQNVSLRIVPVGIVDVHIETNAENGQIIQGQLQGITVGIEDMFLKAIVPSDIPEDETPRYNFDLFNTLWEACGSSSSTGRETFQLKGGKGIPAISGTQSVNLLDVPATSLIQATERHLLMPYGKGESFKTSFWILPLTTSVTPSYLQ
ncbi:unnamed protein product [Sphenostylis stenocarpa]|uniref:AP5B1 middle domain-containing protein n=1 Tax=Sphenostylis stenocarpa TaxID=92480 RepID=A0AA86V3U0_9FABA|nr:unnamed protein product [Sphenostylis stenocarpa]